MSEKEIILELANADCFYEKGRPVLEDVSFCVHRGESVGIIGANGCGKSTLFKAVCGLTAHEGEIRVDGMPVDKKNLAGVRRVLGFVMQDSDSQLFMPTVYDDLAFGLRNRGLSEEEIQVRVDAVLDRLEIIHLKNRQNYKLSGGEKRMICLAVILAMGPQLILLDEPSITLDPFNRRTLINRLNEMPETKLIASHDLDMILETCGRVILLENGRIRADGAAQQILSDRTLLESCRLELPFCMQKVMPYRRKQ